MVFILSSNSSPNNIILPSSKDDNIKKVIRKIKLDYLKKDNSISKEDLEIIKQLDYNLNDLNDLNSQVSLTAIELKMFKFKLKLENNFISFKDFNIKEYVKNYLKDDFFKRLKWISNFKKFFHDEFNILLKDKSVKEANFNSILNDNFLFSDVYVYIHPSMQKYFYYFSDNINIITSEIFDKDKMIITPMIEIKYNLFETANIDYKSINCQYCFNYCKPILVVNLLD